ncbi:MAG TPA: DUF6600 domain-containing protein, partial [Frankiaceae bacterium]|nr:DUF6600 domain-containing protein [Frankiaceae bacterium]
LIVATSLAFTPAPARADDDLPGRVGRISEFAGQLYLSPEDRATEWQGIGLNYPVSSGDNLWVGGDGRAEVDYGGGQFRLAGDTSVHVSRLDENLLALFIAQGRVILRVRALDPGESARIDAPNTQIQLTRPGLYRIDVVPDRQSTAVTVREGEAIVLLANGSQQALPGQMAIVTGPDPAAANVVNGTGQDGFDAWSADRDRYYDRPRGNAYVSREMVGYADLDQYGSWETAPEYGAVWFPGNVAPGWAPYQDGYWTSVAGFGLTWVDAAPWGYAPFHYGRWAWVHGRWGWCPGAYVARPVWAPALVGWVGGPGWRVSASFGAPVYGWVPLGWGEPYHPWWGRCSNDCWTRYNRPYAVNVAERPARPPAHFRNADVPGAVAAVAAPTLSGKLMVREHLVPVPSQQYRSAPVLAAAPAVPSGPPRIPGPRAGTGGTPPPASTYYPVSRGGRVGVEQGARRAAPAATPAAPTAGQPMTRPGGSPPPSAAAQPGTPARGRAATSSPPTAPAPAIVAPPPSGTTTTRARPSQPSTGFERAPVTQPALAPPPATSPPPTQV